MIFRMKNDISEEKMLSSLGIQNYCHCYLTWMLCIYLKVGSIGIHLFAEPPYPLELIISYIIYNYKIHRVSAPQRSCTCCILLMWSRKSLKHSRWLGICCHSLKIQKRGRPQITDHPWRDSINAYEEGERPQEDK